MGLNDEWVDIAELAEMLHTTPRGVYMRRVRGQLPDDWSRIGVYVVWPRSTIDRWMENDGARIRRANIRHAEQRSN